MVDYNLLHSLGEFDAEADAAVALAMGVSDVGIDQLVGSEDLIDLAPGSIVNGRISGVSGDEFLVELGRKSESLLEKGEFDEPENVKVGDEVKVLVEDVDHDSGTVRISKRKADRIINWEGIMKSKKEGDPVSGKATKKIKGGLLVDIGVP